MMFLLHPFRSSTACKRKLPPEVTHKLSDRRLTEAQRVLGILFATGCALGRISHARGSVGNGTPGAFGSVTDGPGQAFGGVAKSISSSTGCKGG